VYKETIFHRRTFHAQPVYPNISSNNQGMSAGYAQTNVANTWEQTQDSAKYNQGSDLRMQSVAHNTAYVDFSRQ